MASTVTISNVEIREIGQSFDDAASDSVIGPGESFQVRFTVKNNLGEAMTGMQWGLRGYEDGRLMETVVQSVSVANGASKTFTATVTAIGEDVEEVNAFLYMRSDGVRFATNSDGEYDANTNFGTDLTALGGAPSAITIGGYFYGKSKGYEISGQSVGWTAGTGARYFIDRRYSPMIETLALERVTITDEDDGEGGVTRVAAPDDEGENVALTLKLNVGYAGWDSFDYQKRLTWDPYGSGGEALIQSPTLAVLIATGVEDDADTLSATIFDKAYDYNVIFAFELFPERVTAAVQLPKAFANLHLSGMSTGGAAFGRFSTSGEGVPKLESEYPAYFYGGIASVGDGDRCTQSQMALGIQAGVVAAESVSAGGTRDFAVTFDQPFRLNTVPVVVAGFSTASTAGAFGRCSCAVLDVSETGFTLRCFNGDTSGRSPSYRWIAVGQTPVEGEEAATVQAVTPGESVAMAADLPEAEALSAAVPIADPAGAEILDVSDATEEV